MSDHTPEPWRQERASKSLHPRSYQRVITDADYEYIIAELFQFGEEDPREANARRIVACVNACKEWTTEQLEAWAADPQSPLLVNELTALRQQVADLRAALNTVLPPWETYRTLPDKAKVRWDSYAGVLKSAYLAATQPQEVQP